MTDEDIGRAINTLEIPGQIKEAQRKISYARSIVTDKAKQGAEDLDQDIQNYVECVEEELRLVVKLHGEQLWLNRTAEELREKIKNERG